MDDLITVADTVDDMLYYMRLVFERFEQANLCIRPTKCKIGEYKYKILGYMITPDGITIDESKLAAISRLQSPTNRKQIRQLLGKLGVSKWLGSALSWCCNVITAENLQKFSSRAESIETYLRTITDSMHDEHQNLVNVSTSIMQISDTLTEEIAANSRNVKAVYSEVQKNGLNNERLAQVQF